ncbi:MAG: hypothetical protein Q8N51_19735, partial [Gammaproteobacteria bacterium]|nr:hypothetical protein [Gammaproteobacteria bacterium]
MSERTVAASCSLARSTVAKYVRRAREAGLSWPLPEGLTDEELDRRVFPASMAAESGPPATRLRWLARCFRTFADTSFSYASSRVADGT